jgi:hypothetical protein
MGRGIGSLLRRLSRVWILGGLWCIWKAFGIVIFGMGWAIQHDIMGGR